MCVRRKVMFPSQAGKCSALFALNDFLSAKISFQKIIDTLYFIIFLCFGASRYINNAKKMALSAEGSGC